MEIDDGELFPVARALTALGVDYIFCSARDRQAVPPEFAHVQFLQKPVRGREVVRALASLRKAE